MHAIQTNNALATRPPPTLGSYRKTSAADSVQVSVRNALQGIRTTGALTEKKIFDLKRDNGKKTYRFHSIAFGCAAVVTLLLNLPEHVVVWSTNLMDWSQTFS